MKVQKIPQELWEALNIVTNEVEHVIVSLNLITDNTNRGLSDKEKLEFVRLQECVDLVKEYAACFGADGRVSQRGKNPHAWNKNTIFTSHEEKGELYADSTERDNEDYSGGDKEVSETAE